MTDILARPAGRRAVLGGMTAGGALLALPACSTIPGFSLVDAVRRLLYLSSERAFARMLQDEGFWDQQVAQLGLGNMLGTRGDVLSRILTSSLFKNRLEDAFADIAHEGAERAAPLVTEAVRTIGIQNAIDLVRGGPTSASAFLRGSMGTRLVEVMVPELGTAMRVAQEPLVAELLRGLTGADISGATMRFARGIDDTIWREIGVEEAAIRERPETTRDPLLIGVFGAAGSAI